MVPETNMITDEIQKNVEGDVIFGSKGEIPSAGKREITVSNISRSLETGNKYR